MENTKINNHISQRISEIWATVKAFNQGMAANAEENRTKVQVIKEMHSRNPNSGAEDYSDMLYTIQANDRDFHLKGQEAKLYQPILVELNLLAELFDIEIDTPEEEKEIYKEFMKTDATIFKVVDGTAVLKPTIKDQVDLQFDKQAKDPKTLSIVFEQILQIKDK